jgi:hypothetical protein
MEVLNKQQWLRQLTALYMNRNHIQHRESMCPIAGLMSEVAKCDDKIKHAFQENLKVTLGKIEKQVGDIRATGIMALFTGAIQMAAASEDPKFQQKLLDDSVQCAVVLMQGEF